MSELKVRFIDDTYVEYYNTGKHDLAQVYLKSEADKVIAELKAREDVLVTDNRDLLEKVKMLENQLRENAEHFKRNEAQILENSDKAIAEKDKEIARLKALAKEPSLSNRVCRKCGKEGTLMYMPAVEDNHTFWDLYNNKGIDYVFSIRCAHCGEVAFVTKETHEYELRRHKYKRCLDKAKWCFTKSNYHFVLDRHGEDAKENNRRSILYSKWRKRWLKIAKKFKEAK